MIDAVEKHHDSEVPSIMAYFYFDFNDPEKQQISSLLRSLLTQLSAQSPRCQDALINLHPKCQERGQQPSSADLLNALKDVIECCGRAYIILDALDESSDQDEVLLLLAEIVHWNLDNLHLFATSRKERRIEDAITDLVSAQKELDSDLIDTDIRTHLTVLLASDSRFRKWTLEERQEIQDTLVHRAHGM